MISGFILAGYPCVGKTTYANKNTGVIDLDSSAWGGDKWYEIYVDRAIKHAKEGKVVFVSTHKEVLEELLRAKNEGIDVIVVHPNKSLADWWIQITKLRYETHLYEKGSDENGRAYRHVADNFYADINSINKISNRNGFINISIGSKNFNFAEIVDYYRKEKKKEVDSYKMVESKLDSVTDFMKELTYRLDTIDKRLSELETPSDVIVEDDSPKRDDEYMQLFAKEFIKIWSKNPEMRFGQLIGNVIQDPSLYYMEDEKVIETLNKYYDALLNNSF